MAIHGTLIHLMLDHAWLCGRASLKKQNNIAMIYYNEVSAGYVGMRGKLSRTFLQFESLCRKYYEEATKREAGRIRQSLNATVALLTAIYSHEERRWKQKKMKKQEKSEN